MPVWELLVVAFLILLNGFFAMSELAVVSSRRARLEQLAEDRVRGARAALKLLDEPTRFLSTVQVGITLVGVLAGAYSGTTLAEPLGDALFAEMGQAAYPVSVGIVVAGITYLSLVIGELVPKRIAMNDPERTAARVAPFMARLSVAGAPVVWLLRASTEALIRLLRVPEKPESTVTEEEVKSLIAEGTRAGVFHAVERDMIDGVLRLADRSVRSVMTPRVEVVWIDLDDPVDTIQKEIAESGHSRFPAGRRGLEELDGIAHTKDLLNQAVQTGSFDIVASLRDPLVVHEGTPVLRLLEMFRENPVHMAVVVDEYGATRGIVTLEDVIEQIVGDIEDEFDPASQAEFVPEGESYRVAGHYPLHSLRERLSLPDVNGAEVDTIGGYVIQQLGRWPRQGDSVELGGYTVRVTSVQQKRISQVMITPKTQAIARADGPGKA